MQNQTPEAEPQDRDVYEGQTVHRDRNRVDHVVVDEVKQNADHSGTGWSRSLSHEPQADDKDWHLEKQGREVNAPRLFSPVGSVAIEGRPEQSSCSGDRGQDRRRPCQQFPHWTSKYCHQNSIGLGWARPAAAYRGTMDEPSASSTRARSVDELAPSAGCHARSGSGAPAPARPSAASSG